MKPVFLPAIDLEDVRLWMPDGARYRPRVPDCTAKYLDFFRRHKVRATFFVVGEVAALYPDLVRRIADEGHEVASHSMHHVPLDRMTPQEFAADTERSLDALRAAGVASVAGYRAPIFSLVERTAWAHGALARLGFTYSSSVLPAKSPLYGWPEFGAASRTVDGVLEIPMTVGNALGLKVPFSGGVYFRVLPFTLIRHLTRSHAAVSPDRPIPGYFHPYDVDTEQERFMHPGIHGSHFYNWLMYFGRGGMLRKLESFLDCVTTQTCAEYAKALRERPGSPSQGASA